MELSTASTVTASNGGSAVAGIDSAGVGNTNVTVTANGANAIAEADGSNNTKVTAGAGATATSQDTAINGKTLTTVSATGLGSEADANNAQGVTVTASGLGSTASISGAGLDPGTTVSASTATATNGGIAVISNDGTLVSPVTAVTRDTVSASGVGSTATILDGQGSSLKITNGEIFTQVNGFNEKQTNPALQAVVPSVAVPQVQIPTAPVVLPTIPVLPSVPEAPSIPVMPPMGLLH